MQRDLFAARTVINHAAASLRHAAAGLTLDEAVASCARSVEGLDAVVARIHRQLRQSTGPASDQQP